MYYGARFYSPRLGRFISADTLICHPRNPQAWNRYSYVLNNPLYYVDPTGHQQAAVGVGLIVLELADPLPLDPLLIPAAVTLVVSDPWVQQALLYANLYSPYAPALAEQASNAGQGLSDALQRAGNTASQNPFDPNDPFRGLPERVQRGVQTLQRLASDPHIPQRFRLGYQAQLERAKYWAGRGRLTGVEITGEGGVRFDLELGQSTVVEVKYWTARYAMSHIGELARQLGTYQAQGKQIILEMFQTATNPLTEENWRYILESLQRASINISSQSQLLPPLQ